MKPKPPTHLDLGDLAERWGDEIGEEPLALATELLNAGFNGALPHGTVFYRDEVAELIPMGMADLRRMLAEGVKHVAADRAAILLARNIFIAAQGARAFAADTGRSPPSWWRPPRGPAASGRISQPRLNTAMLDVARRAQGDGGRKLTQPQLFAEVTGLPKFADASRPQLRAAWKFVKQEAPECVRSRGDTDVKIAAEDKRRG